MILILLGISLVIIWKLKGEIAGLMENYPPVDCSAVNNIYGKNTAPGSVYEKFAFNEYTTFLNAAN